MRLVAQHKLRSDDRCGSRLAHDEGGGVGQGRNERALKPRQFIFKDLSWEAQDELAECDESKGK
jgi:hypothetical protein